MEFFQLQFLLNRRNIVSEHSDHMVRVWDALTGQIVINPLKCHDHAITSVASSSDENSQIVGCSDGSTV